MSELIVELQDQLRVLCRNAANDAIVYTDHVAAAASPEAPAGFHAGSLCAAGLGACCMTILGYVAARKGIDIHGAYARVADATDEKHTRIAKIAVDFMMPPRDYSEREKKLLENAIKSCPVHRSLHPDVTQTFTFHWQ